MRLVMITDFTEQFSYKLLRGIMAWSRRQEQPWVVCKMPPSYKREIGIPRVVEWAKNWRADVVVGQFDPDDDVTLFRKNGIVAIAQDYISQFPEIPNLTGDYYLTGVMAARRLCGHGFKNLGFFGYENVCWSDGRLKGFQETLRKDYHIDNLHIFMDRQLSSLWSYDTSALQQ